MARLSGRVGSRKTATVHPFALSLALQSSKSKKLPRQWLLLCWVKEQEQEQASLPNLSKVYLPLNVLTATAFRSQPTSESSSSISSRVKRRAICSIINDENANPKAAQSQYRSTPYDEDGIQLDALENSLSQRQRREVVTKPTHYISEKELVTLSSDKIVGQFEILKANPSMSCFGIWWNDFFL